MAEDLQDKGVGTGVTVAFGSSGRPSFFFPPSFALPGPAGERLGTHGPRGGGQKWTTPGAGARRSRPETRRGRGGGHGGRAGLAGGPVSLRLGARGPRGRTRSHSPETLRSEGRGPKERHPVGGGGRW